MKAEEHDRSLVSFAGVSARLLADRTDLADALAVLDEAEAAVGVPLVDESERQRLEAAVAGDGSLAEHHHAVLAHRGGACVGYAGVVIPDGDLHGVGDVAFPHALDRCGDVLRALLEAVDAVVLAHDAHGTQMWIRHATAEDVVTAVAAGYAVERRLAVLGCRLPAPTAAGNRPDDLPDDLRDGVHIRPATPDDAEAVVAVLDAAYGGSPDGHWDHDRFAQHTAADWFRFEDLLVAADDAGLLGLHWTKRREDTIGEVFNLAVAPRAQGRGLGRHLLDAGLTHLGDVGCDEVLLWVDLANEAAVRLYTRAGFTTRWEDVAFVRHARGVGRHDHPPDGHNLRPEH